MKVSTIITAIVAASALLSTPVTATQRGLKADNSNKNENAVGKNSNECSELAEWVAGRIGPSTVFFLENVAKDVVMSGDVEPTLIIAYLLKYIKEQADLLGVGCYYTFDPSIAGMLLHASEETATIQLGSGDAFIAFLKASLSSLGEEYGPGAFNVFSQQLNLFLTGYSNLYKTGTVEENDVVRVFFLLFSSAVVMTLLSGFATACGGPVPGERPVRQEDVKDVLVEYLLEIAANGLFGYSFKYLGSSTSYEATFVEGFLGINPGEISLEGTGDFLLGWVFIGT